MAVGKVAKTDGMETGFVLPKVKPNGTNPASVAGDPLLSEKSSAGYLGLLKSGFCSELPASSPNACHWLKVIQFWPVQLESVFE